MIIRCYSELIRYANFNERYEYLKLSGGVGEETFGFDRFLNQRFYKSAQWKSIRDYVMIRDNGCDLGVNRFEIDGKILIHHMNPITVVDIQNNSDFLMNPEYLISTTIRTHNAIHYGIADYVSDIFTERKPNDTCPWKRR